MLLTGLVYWLVTPVDSPDVPPRLLLSSLDSSDEQEGSADQNEPTKISRKSTENAATVSPIRVFACTANQEPDRSGIMPSEITKSTIQNTLLRHDWTPVKIEESEVHSKNPEHLLMAAMLGSEGTNKSGVSTLENALAADPDNRLTLWNYLDYCSFFRRVAVCADGSIEKRAIRADSGNGQLWGKIAGYRFGSGDIEGAYDALINANTSPRFNGYFIEHVEMFERGFAALTDAPYRKRITDAIGIAAIRPIFLNIIQSCKEQAEAPKWRQVCLDYGKRLENDGRAVITMRIGILLQKEMYKMTADETMLKETDHRYRLITDTMESGYSDDGLVLLAYDDQVLADYMNEWSAHGEYRAMQFLQAEVVRLSKEPGYDPCMLRVGKSAQVPVR